MREVEFEGVQSKDERKEAKEILHKQESTFTHVIGCLAITSNDISHLYTDLLSTGTVRHNILKKSR